MIKKYLSLLLIAFAIAANFCFAQPITTTASLEDVVVPLELKKDGIRVTLSGSESKVSLQKGQQLIVTVNGDAVSRYKLVYQEPSFMNDGHPSIYYTLDDPYSSVGWYEWSRWIQVMKEEPKLNTTTANSISLHFVASDVGTKEITVNVFDDCGHLNITPAYSQEYQIIASYTIMVTVK